MGFVKKQASDLNDTRKSITSELERGITNPNVWMAAAAVAAPYAIGAMSMSGAAGGGFLSTWGTGAQAIGGAAKAGIMKGAGALKGLFAGDGGPMGPPAPGEPAGGFFGGARNILGSMSDKIKEKMGDEGYMADMMMRAGKHLAGSALAGDGLSDEERKLMQAMAGDLDKLKGQDQMLFDKQMGIAEEVLAGARASDPEYTGLKAQRDVQQAGGIQMREADREAKMREGGRGLSAADRRRAGLEITRDAQSAYLEGKETGQDTKNKALTTAAGLLPRPPTLGLDESHRQLANQGDAAGARADAVSNTGVLIEDVIRGDAAKAVGDKVKDGLKDMIPI